MTNDKLRATYHPQRLAPPAIVSSTVLYQAWCPLCSWETEQLVDIRQAEEAADTHQCEEEDEARGRGIVPPYLEPNQ